MSSPLEDSNEDTKRNEFGPDYLGYYKHVVSELVRDDSLDSKPSIQICEDNGADTGSAGDPNSLFRSGVCEGLSECKKERLKALLNESVVCINQEVDEVLSHIIGLFQVESDVRERELLSYCSDGTFDDIKETVSGMKRGSSSPILDNPIGDDDTSNAACVRQVYKLIEARQGDGELFSDAVENYSIDLCSQLGKMEHDLEVYINSVVSNSRPMTHAEKYQLAERIQKLPDKSLDRVVELIQHRNLTARHSSDNVHVNLEEQDTITLWRLYYYVEVVMKANKLQ